MTTEDLNDLYSVYSHAIYVGIKYPVTIPSVLVGNVIDLCTFGLSKYVINVSPLMTRFPFFKEATRSKEQDIHNESTFFNRGFAGLFRAVASIAIELPAVIASSLIGAVFTALHIIIANTIGSSVSWLAGQVANNMFAGH